ncbi:hypothetical protein [uncultured Sphingomonas sp.]|uniref:hypothetical protein n=1 Tax=uncultured Sphingomonas sp. TaxID=158754 RepID=UPI00374820D2
MTERLTLALAAKFCTGLLLSQKQEIAARLGIERVGAGISSIDQDKMFLRAVRDAGKLGQLSAYIDALLPPSRDHGRAGQLAVVDEAGSAPFPSRALNAAEASWTGDPYKLAAELRRVASVFDPKAGFRLPQLLRDAADEIDSLTALLCSGGRA